MWRLTIMATITCHESVAFRKQNRQKHSIQVQFLEVPSMSQSIWNILREVEGRGRMLQVDFDLKLLEVILDTFTSQMGILRKAETGV